MCTAAHIRLLWIALQSNVGTVTTSHWLGITAVSRPLGGVWWLNHPLSISPIVFLSLPSKSGKIHVNCRYHFQQIAHATLLGRGWKGVGGWCGCENYKLFYDILGILKWPKINTRYKSIEFHTLILAEFRSKLLLLKGSFFRHGELKEGDRRY